MQLALAAGVGFFARGFAGNPNELARLIVAGITHPGFAVIHVLSPCVTFRAEQRGWKQAVHGFDGAPATDPATAMARFAGDDGFTTGILYASATPPFMPERQMTMTAADFDRGFIV